MRITTLNHNLNTSKVTNMSSMFKGIQVSRLDLSSLNTSNVTNMSHMFQELPNNNQQNIRNQILILNIQHFDYGKVTDASYMFARRRHYKLTSYNFEFGEVNDFFDQSVHGLNLQGMFSDLPINVREPYFWLTHSPTHTGVEEIFAPVIKTDRAVNCNQMFRGTLHKKIDLYDCDFTKNVINMNRMFEACQHAEQIDICSFTSQKLQTCQRMFSLAQKTQAIRSSFNFRPDLIENSSLGRDDPTYNMFSGCQSLGLGQIEGSDVALYDASKINGQMAKIDMKNQPGYFCGEIIYLAIKLSNRYNSQKLQITMFAYSKRCGYSGAYDDYIPIASYGTIYNGSFPPLNIMKHTAQLYRQGDSSASSYTESQIRKKFIFYGDKNLKVVADNSGYPLQEMSARTSNDITPHFRSLNIKLITDETIYYRFIGSSTSTGTQSFTVSRFGGVNSWIAQSSGSSVSRRCYPVIQFISEFQFFNPYTETYESGWLPDFSNFRQYNIDYSDMFSYMNSLTSIDFSRLIINNAIGGSMVNIFRNCSSLTSLDLSNFNTSSVTNMISMFDGCSSLTSLDLSNFNTSNVTNMSSMFNDCMALTSLDLSDFNTSNVTDMRYMFCDCRALTSLDLSNFNTSNVTNMYAMFNTTSSLVTLDISSFNTSNVTDMSSMFRCPKLESLNLSNFNTSNVTNMSYMFGYCSSLASLDLSNFDTSNVTDMRNMFFGCEKLTSLDVSNFDTGKVANMTQLFYRCYEIQVLDLSSFNTFNVTNMSSMFGYNRKLKYIIASLDFTTTQISSSSVLFIQCDSLIGGKGTIFNSNQRTALYARIDNAPDNPGYFWSMAEYEDFVAGPPVLSISRMQQQIPKQTATKISTLTKQQIPFTTYTSIKESGGGDIWVTNNGTEYTICTNKDEIYLPTNCFRIFWYYTLLTALDLSNFNTSNVVNMDGMFSICKSLTSLDVTNFNTSNVNNMSSMFQGCQSLTSLDVTNFNTSNVNNMSSMFYNCQALTSLDV